MRHVILLAKDIAEYNCSVMDDLQDRDESYSWHDFLQVTTLADLRPDAIAVYMDKGVSKQMVQGVRLYKQLGIPVEYRFIAEPEIVLTEEDIAL